jgi:hypothetical protein
MCMRVYACVLHLEYFFTQKKEEFEDLDDDFDDDWGMSVYSLTMSWL